MFRSKVLLAIIVSLLAVSTANADSLWKKTSSSPYTPDKSYKIGDLITIIVVENTSAQQKAGTNTNVKDDMGLKLTHTFDRIASLIGKDTAADLTVKNKYAGAGSTQRASVVTTKIAATVTEVMDNGNIKIDGSHRLDVNDETQEILVSGVVRTKDISAANTIYSYQIANAEVSVRGSGVVQEAESPGWLTRIFNWLF